MVHVEELNNEELKSVTGGYAPIPVDHYAFNLQTGRIEAYDENGNVIDETVLR